MSRRWHQPVRANHGLTYNELMSVKEHLSQECGHKCVYCGHKEQLVRHYHVEHYRPKKLRPDLERALDNLFIACCVCNTYKSDDWPNEPDDLQFPCYPDPIRHDYNSLFNISLDGTATSNVPAGAYTLVRLALNRTQLVQDRQEEVIRKKMRDLSHIYSQSTDAVEKGRFADILAQCLDWMTSLPPPHTTSAVTRPVIT